MTDLETIVQQERLLTLPGLSCEEAWRVGALLRNAALARNAAMTFDIHAAGRTLFTASTGEAPAGQLHWIRRKRNTVLRFARSSYAMGLELEASGKTLEYRHGLSLADFALHGGGFPILLRGTGCIGAIVASGLTQREDHNMVVKALAEAFAIDVPMLP